MICPRIWHFHSASLSAFDIHILLLVIVMFGAVFALLITLVMIFLVVLKGRRFDGHTFFCRKSELVSIIDTISEDSVIQIWIGRNSYEHEGAGNS